MSDSITNIQIANKESNYSDYIRLVLIGKTGNGKSATANNLIGQKNYFRSGSNQAYVTQHCQAVTFSFNQKKILLVDTPGFADIIREESYILDEIKKLMEYTYPGPHAFIIVLSAASRFTKEEKYCIDLISSFFGRNICDHSLVLFSYIDNLEEDGITLSEYVLNSQGVDDIKQLISKCHNNYLGVSNRWRTDEDKMIKFRLDCFNMINKIIIDKRDGNEYYTSDQFRAAYKYYEEEKKRIQKAQLDEINRVRELNEQKVKLEEENRRLQQRVSNANRGGGGCGGGGCSIS